MEIFCRRYLCFFTFLFILTSALCTMLSYGAKHAALMTLALLAATMTVIIICVRRNRFALSVVLVSLIFSFLAVLNSFVFISLPSERASSYVSEASEAELKVISCEYSGESASEYIVKIERINGENADVKAYLYCDFPSSLDYGDKMISSFNISHSADYIDVRGDIPLSLSVNSGAPVMYKEAEAVSYLSADGVMHICRLLREAFGEYVDGIFGESSGIVKGFLIDDRTDIPQHVQNDFKRSGTTHLLAVSGMHIVVLLGSVEFLLKKIYVPKKIRCVIISLAALMLLMLTDFSGSAVRSVLMLYCVYVSYLFYEDHDTLTALFFSVFLIIFLSPYSVYDIGMWMSFLATLGLVTVYVYLDKKLPRPTSRKATVRCLQKLWLGILRAILITLTANFFLLPIMWAYFGEISLSALGANLLLSPIVGVFMPFCAIGVLVGWISPLSVPLTFVASAFERVILSLADFFANMRGAVLSLSFPFVKWLVMIFCISMAVLLVIKLRKRLLILLPSIAFVAAFCICMAVFSLTSSPDLRRVASNDSQMLFYDDVSRSVVCDLSKGGYEGVGLFLQNRNPYATELEDYVIVKPYRSHAYAVERILCNSYIRTLYLPKPTTNGELSVAMEIFDVAERYGSEVVFYEGKEGIVLFGDLLDN